MLSIIQDQIRLFLIAASLQGIELRTMDMGLPRQKSMWWLHVYMIFKTMSMSIIAKALEAYGLRGTGWETLSMVLDIVLSALVYILYIVQWEGEALHILLVANAGEFITYPTMLVILLVNKLEGRSSLTLIEGPFMALDLLIPAGIILSYFLARPLLKRVMHFLGNQRLPHRNILWTAFFVYFIYSRIPDLLYQNRLEDGMGTFIIGEIALLGLLFVLLLLMLVIYQASIHKQEEAFLTLQINMLRQRALIVKNAQADYVAARELLATQMRQLQEKMDACESIAPEEIEENLSKLRKLFGSEYRGVYCKDALVDEMLSQIRETVEAGGGKLQVSIKQYDLGRVNEEDLVRLLFCLQQAAKRPEYGEEISMTSTGSQFLLTFKSAGFSFLHRSFMTLQTVIRKYKGDISIHRLKEQTEIVIIL